MADKNLGLYSPSQGQFIVNGRTGGGFADGTYIRTSRNRPDEFSTKTGAYGEGTFVENLDKSGVITISLKQNAAEEHKFYRALLESKAVFPIQYIRSANYRETITGVNCMVKTSPRKDQDQDESNRDWEFSVLELIETDKAS